MSRDTPGRAEIDRLVGAKLLERLTGAHHGVDGLVERARPVGEPVACGRR